MAKAFTEEDKKEIREKLLEAGLRLFKEKGLKKVSVRELTEAASIAQGGFYTFFESKEELFLACVRQRLNQKMSVFFAVPLEQYGAKIQNPIRFLTERLYQTGMHLKDNLAFNNLVSDSVNALLGNYGEANSEGIDIICKILDRLVNWWQEHGVTVIVEKEALPAFIRAEAVLFMNEEIIGKEYFPEIFHLFIEENVRQYFRVEGEFQK